MFKVNKDTRMTPSVVPSISIVNFEQITASWVNASQCERLDQYEGYTFLYAE